ncbi:MAG: hypothetical protein IIZ94_15015 [Prevotella sp.]|nr:hypothetical protein [Prevotella sp.]
MASNGNIRYLGNFESIQEVWAALPGGGQQGDYITINGNTFSWNKFIRQWQNSSTVVVTPTMETKTHDGDYNVGNNIRVGGDLIVIGKIINDSIKNGKSAYEVWLEEDGNEGKSLDAFWAFLTADKGYTKKPVQTLPSVEQAEENTLYIHPNSNNTYSISVLGENGFINLVTRNGDMTRLFNTTIWLADNDIDYSGCVSEFLICNISHSITAISCKAYSGNLYVKVTYLINGETVSVISIKLLSEIQDNVVIPLFVTSPYGSDEYKAGTIIGYIVFKDVTTFGTLTSSNDVLCSITYVTDEAHSPAILDSIKSPNGEILMPINGGCDYSGMIAELLLVKQVTSGHDLRFKFFDDNGNIYLRCYSGNTLDDWGVVASASEFVDGKVYELKATTAGTNVNVGDLVAYIIFKDIDAIKGIGSDTGRGQVVNIDMATNIVVNSNIRAWLMTQVMRDKTDSVELEVLKLYPMFTFNEPKTIENTPITNTGYESGTSTFSGWGMTLCENKTIKSVTINVKNRDASAMTSVTFLLCKASMEGIGDVLASKTISVNIEPSDNADVTCEFDEPVYYQGLIYLKYACDKLVTRLGWADATNYPYKPTDGYPKGGYFINGGTTWYTNTGTNESAFWVKYVSLENHLSDEQVDYIASKIGGGSGGGSVNSKIEICLPDEINAVVGDTLQLYYKSIFRCLNPYNYDIKVTCDIGDQYPRYYEVTPDSSHVGRHNISFIIRDNNNNSLGEKTVKLNVVQKSSSPNLNILCVGASNMTSGVHVGEIKKRLTTANGTTTGIYEPIGFNLQNVNFVGRVEKTYDNDSVRFEAIGGWNFDRYNATGVNTVRFYFTQVNAPNLSLGDVYTDGTTQFTVVEINIPQSGGEYYGNINTSVLIRPSSVGLTLTKVSGNGDEELVAASYEATGNPFVFDNQIDFQAYADEYCDGQIDVILTDLFGNLIIQQYQEDFTQTMMKMQTFINNVRSDFPNCKFMICTSQMKDEKGGLGVWYHAGTNAYAYHYGLKYGCMNLITALQEYINENDMGDYVFICNTLNEFDVENNYTKRNKQVNVRSVDIEAFGRNGVHPDYSGLYQMADAAVRLFVAKFCQENT